MSGGKRIATLIAGVPASNPTLYRQVRFLVGDPAAWVRLPVEDGSLEEWFIVRDIEMQRARQQARANRVFCPADFTPQSGLSGDRETATAQSVAECLLRQRVEHVVADRSLPLIYADHIQQLGISVECDLSLGVMDRRHKDDEEIAWLAEAQSITEQAVERACQTVAASTVDAGGILQWEGAALTSERLRAIVDVWLLEQGYDNPSSIIAGGRQGGDCHEHGSGLLRTGQPIIVDIFPQCRATRYFGDCTRTVVHGEISAHVARMHDAVVAAKRRAIEVCRAGVTGEDVHRATIAVISAHGYQLGLPGPDEDDSYCAMTHGTGHGVGLDVHEPPLLDHGGPELVTGDALTIEPGLYCLGLGGVRVEDMVIVTDDGCENLNSLQDGLAWD